MSYVDGSSLGGPPNYRGTSKEHSGCNERRNESRQELLSLGMELVEVIIEEVASKLRS